MRFIGLLFVSAILLLCSSCSKQQNDNTTETPHLASPSSVTLAVASGDQELNQGIDLHDEGEYLEAIPLLESAVTKSLSQYEKSDVYNFIGSCHFELDDFAKAKDAYDRSLEENPDQHNVWVNKGVCLRNMDQMTEAEECYKKALSLNSEHAPLHSSLGSLYLLQDKNQEAIQSFQRAIELDPSLAVTHGNYAWALGKSGDFAAAERELKTAERLGYANVEAIQEMLDELKAESASDKSSE